MSSLPYGEGRNNQPWLSSSPAPADVFLDKEDSDHGGDEQHGHDGQDDGGRAGGCCLQGEEEASRTGRYQHPPKHNQHPSLSWGIKATKSLQHPARIQAGKRPWADSGRTVLPITNLLAPRVQAGDGPMPSAVTAPGQCHCHLPAGWG